MPEMRDFWYQGWPGGVYHLRRDFGNAVARCGRALPAPADCNNAHMLSVGADGLVDREPPMGTTDSGARVPICRGCRRMQLQGRRQ